AGISASGCSRSSSAGTGNLPAACWLISCCSSAKRRSFPWSPRSPARFSLEVWCSASSGVGSPSWYWSLSLCCVMLLRSVVPRSVFLSILTITTGGYPGRRRSAGLQQFPDPAIGPQERFVLVAARNRVPAAVGPRIGAKEPQARTEPVQPADRVGHALLGQVPFRIQAEEIVAEELSGWPGLDPAQVHPPAGELFQDRHQRPGVV